MSEEEALHAPSTVRALLRRHGLPAQQSFGQNFLIDRHALQAVVEAAGVGPTDTVLEVGPGLGVLTHELSKRAARVVAVELDRRLEPVLAETLAGRENVEIVWKDALKFDFTALPAGSLLVANLPYNIATPLLVTALESRVFSRLVAMVQREVAERLVATAGDEQYGAVSLITRYYSEARIVRNVAPGSFYPAPEVTSAIVRLDARGGVRPRPQLFAVVRDAFRHRRKTLARNLQMATDESIAQAVCEAAREVGGEALDLAAFEKLSESLPARGS